MCSFGSPVLQPVQKYQPLCMSVALISRQFPTVTAHPCGIHCLNKSLGIERTSPFFKNSRNLGFIRQRLENHLYRALFFLLLCFRSTYLPETPSLGAGRHGLHQARVNISQVSAQICIFTLPATTAGCIRGTLCAVTHADESVSNPGLMLTPKISLSRMQKRQTSCRAWVTRLTVD